MEAEAEEVLCAQEEAKQAATIKETELKAISAEFDTLKGDVSVIQGVEVDLKNKMDNCSKKLKENELTRQQWMKKLQEMRRNHEEDMREHRSYLEGSSSSTKKAHSEGAEESKGGEQDDTAGDETDSSSEVSQVLRPLADIASDKLVEMVTMMAKRGKATSRNAKQAKRGRRAIKPDSDDEEEEDAEDDEEGGEGEGERSKAQAGLDELKRDINLLEAERDRLKETVNLTSLMDYKKKDEEFRSRLAEVEEITAERNAARKDYEDLRRKRLEEFMSGFGIITLKLKEMYQMITLGGDAELELVDSLDPFSEGIVFSVRPPKKSWKNISNLSGGEKTLSSLALVFALHHFKPTPLYVMDEIDAALDFKNVSIVANYIKDRTKNAQFVIISLRNNMFELANRLVGIYKTNDATKSVTINPASFSAAVSGSSDPAPKRISQTGSEAGGKLMSSDSATSDKVAVLGDSTNQL
jgi:structural maintenance of chromosome 4